MQKDHVTQTKTQGRSGSDSVQHDSHRRTKEFERQREMNKKKRRRELQMSAPVRSCVPGATNEQVSRQWNMSGPTRLYGWHT